TFSAILSSVAYTLSAASALVFGFSGSGLLLTVSSASPNPPDILIVCVFLSASGSAIKTTSVLSIPKPANDKIIDIFMFFGNLSIASRAFPLKTVVSALTGSSTSDDAGFRVVKVTFSRLPSALAFRSEERRVGKVCCIMLDEQDVQVSYSSII